MRMQRRYEAEAAVPSWHRQLVYLGDRVILKEDTEEEPMFTEGLVRVVQSDWMSRLSVYHHRIMLMHSEYSGVVGEVKLLETSEQYRQSMQSRFGFIPYIMDRFALNSEAATLLGLDIDKGDVYMTIFLDFALDSLDALECRRMHQHRLVFDRLNTSDRLAAFKQEMAAENPEWAATMSEDAWQGMFEDCLVWDCLDVENPEGLKPDPYYVTQCENITLAGTKRVYCGELKPFERYPKNVAWLG